MKTLEEAIQKVKDYKGFENRPATRLGLFLPKERLKEIDLELLEGVSWTPREWTRENILEQLKDDVEFGFEKALNKRGISASLMHDVVCFWNWVLEDGLEEFDEYEQYGLPTFKATAIKYGWSNPIGDDKGHEFKYSSEYDEEE